MDFHIEDEIVNEVNPWKKSFRLIGIGMLITVYKFNINSVDLLVAILSELMVFLGIRMFRKMNLAFKVAYILEIIHMICTLIEINNSSNVFGVLNGFLFVMMLFFIQGGISSEVTRQDGDEVPIATGLFAAYRFILILVSVTVDELGYFGYVLWAINLIMIILVIRSGKKMVKYGYEFSPSPVKISSTLLNIGYIAIAVVVFIVTSLLINIPTSNGTAIDIKEVVASEAGQELIKKGFPEEVLQMLSMEEVETMAGAESVKIEGEEDDFAGNGLIESKNVFVKMDDQVAYIIMSFKLKDKSWGRDGIGLIMGNRLTADTVACKYVYGDGENWYKEDIRELGRNVYYGNDFMADMVSESNEYEFVGEYKKHNMENEGGYVIIKAEGLSYYEQPHRDDVYPLSACLDFDIMNSAFPISGKDYLNAMESNRQIDASSRFVHKPDTYVHEYIDEDDDGQCDDCIKYGYNVEEE